MKPEIAREKIALRQTLVKYHRETSSGYGFVQHVRATLISVTEKRLRVKVDTKDGGTKVISVRSEMVYDVDQCPICEMRRKVR